MWLPLLITFLLVAFLYYKTVKLYKYWEQKGCVNEQPVYFFGNLAPIVFRIKSLEEVIKDIYKKFSNHRYVGFYQFTTPVFLIRDPELIKQITIKDFDTFADHSVVSANVDSIWDKGLFQLSYKDGWHSMRSTLSPSFTGNKMKNMFGLMQECARQFINHLESHDQKIPINVKDIFTRFANDIIFTTAFGISTDSLKNRENELYLMGKDVSNFSGIRSLKFFGYAISPTLMKLFGVTMFSAKAATFFKKIIKQTIDYRQVKNIVRPDMLHLMMEAQKNQQQNQDNKILTDEDITAQALTFFIAGFDSVSTVVSFLAYQLAVNPDVQQKLYKEITDTMPNEDSLLYETIPTMKYLDNVVSEILRLHSAAIVLDRKCRKPFTIDPVHPSENPLHLDEGTKLWIPISAIHSDEQYFTNPKKFDPDRFNDENKTKIKPFTYLPFGSGPRNCVGYRFALLEMKLLFVEILRHFEIVPNEKTQIPLKLSLTNVSRIPDEGIWLTFKSRARC